MSRLRLVVTTGALITMFTAATGLIAAVAPLAPQGPSAVADGPGTLERVAVLPTLDAPAPRRTHGVEPEWPVEARDAGRTGAFRMHVVVDANGDVAEARVVAPAGPGARPASDAGGQALQRAALAAVRQWRFDPPPAAPMLIVTEVAVGESAPAASPTSDAPVRVGDGVRPPRKVYDVPPRYPDEAKSAGISGVVIMELVLERTGDVADVRVVRSVPGLDAAAIEAVRQWKYEPRADRLQMTVTVNFTLARDDPQP